MLDSSTYFLNNFFVWNGLNRQLYNKSIIMCLFLYNIISNILQEIEIRIFDKAAEGNKKKIYKSNHILLLIYTFKYT
jgi:hypothetical protein